MIHPPTLSLRIVMGLGLWGALALPPVRDALESTMTLHMLVQLPLLAVLGFLVGRLWHQASGSRSWGVRTRAAIDPFNAGGITGVVAASFVMIGWMLPRALDAARMDIATDLWKYGGVTAAGVAVAWSWPRVPAIARGVIHLEVIATLLRFGWAYLATPDRLCASYLAGDQQRAGGLLLWAALAYGVAAIWRPVFGEGAENPGSLGRNPAP